MALKEKFGLVYSAFGKITADETDGAHPTYGTLTDLGAAVKAYLTINHAEGTLYGDDVKRLAVKEFTGATLEAETLLNDLEVDATLFGSTYSSTDKTSTDKAEDAANYGGYAYVQKLKDASNKTIYRAVWLYKVLPTLTNDNSDTKADGLTFAHKAVTYDVSADQTGAWRVRQDFDSLAAAKTWLGKVAAGTADS